MTDPTACITETEVKFSDGKSSSPYKVYTAHKLPMWDKKIKQALVLSKLKNQTNEVL